MAQQNEKVVQDSAAGQYSAAGRWSGRVMGVVGGGLALLLFVVVGGCGLFGGGTEPSIGSAPEGSFVEAKTEALARALSYVDAQGFVDYDALLGDRAGLDAYYNSVVFLDRVAYEKWDEARQIAFWCNTYNALTLQIILENFPIETSLQGSLTPGVPDESIRQIPNVWSAESFTVMGEKISLETIEHEILRKDFREPRIHLAINCASVGCPALRNEPYQGSRLEEQLREQVQRFVRDPSKFRIDRDAKTVFLNPILDWFGEDFLGFLPEAGFGGGSDQERAVLAWLAAAVDAEDARFLKAGDYELEWLDYDWGLNRVR